MKVQPGGYLLQVVLTDGKKLRVENHLPIRVEDKDGKKLVTVIEETLAMTGVKRQTKLRRSNKVQFRREWKGERR